MEFFFTRMMILPIVLVFAVNMFGAYGQDCQWHEFGCYWDGFRDGFLELFVKPEPLDVEICHCVRTHQCYPEDISKQRICYNTFFNNDVNPNYICCRNPVRRITVKPPPRRPTTFTTQKSSFLGGPWGPTRRPSQRPEGPTQGPHPSSFWAWTTKRPSQRPQDTSQAASPTHTDCNCMSLSVCHGDDIKRNKQNQQVSCPNPRDVCCMSKPVTASQPQPQSPSSISTQDQTLGTSPRPQSQSPTQASPPVDETCTCTPFYKCFDEETSSNLTGLVTDRFATPNNDESCSDPNDVCCYNLVKITAKPVEDHVSEDCMGSCIFIQECPYFVNKLKEAQGGNSDAVQELRSSICARTNGVLHVCCPLISKGAANGGDNTGDNNNFGVKWPEEP